MALFVLIGVLRGFPAAAYRRTPHRKPLCGLDQNKNCSFLNWTPIECFRSIRILIIFFVYFVAKIFVIATEAQRH
jgi:hypothetical protein